jgi:hypothetical protein
MHQIDKPYVRSVWNVLRAAVTGPNTVWSSVAAGAFLMLMFLAIKTLGSGRSLLAPLLAAGAGSLFMGFRGTLGRPQPVWYRRLLEAAALVLIVTAIGSALLAGLLVVLRVSG